MPAVTIATSGGVRDTNWTNFLRAHHGLERLDLVDEDARPFHFDDLLPLEITQEPGDRFPGRPDHLGHLLVRENDAQPESLRCLLAGLAAPLQKEAGQA